MKFYNTDIREQETELLFDYYGKVLNVYSSRKAVIERFYKKLGEPNKTDYINNCLTGACWKIPFSDKKRMNCALSKTLIIGQMK